MDFCGLKMFVDNYIGYQVYFFGDRIKKVKLPLGILKLKE